MVYTEKAMARLNKIDWKNIGTISQEKDMELGYEFIRRMAGFCDKYDIKPTLPFMMNIAAYFQTCEITEEILV